MHGEYANTCDELVSVSASSAADERVAADGRGKLPERASAAPTDDS